VSSAPLRILVADDEPTARRLMRAALEKAGFAVATAADGEEALREFAAQRCDMVMLDVDMPARSGFEVCAELRRIAGDELPIVMVTGMDDLQSIETAYECGATDFIAKPINWALIGHRVRYLFRGCATVQQLRAAHARNAAILDAIPDTLFRVDDSGRVLEARGADHTHDRRHVPAPGRALAHSYPPEVAQRLQDCLDSARATAAAQDVDFSLRDEHGVVRYYETRVAMIDAREALCLVRDITERKEAERRIYRLAYFDSLTGLPNRQAFLERLGREVERAQSDGRKLGVLFMDLDGFKNVNDTLGHKTGDLILQWAADRLHNGIRPTDVAARAGADHDGSVELARLGGDEFTALIRDLERPTDALVVAHRIRELMRRPFVIDGREVVLTASIGVALYPDDGVDAATLLKHADTAMYHAKDNGRDNCQFYSSSLTEQAMQRLNLESSLRLALERGEFRLVYQPQFDLDAARVRSVEALLRWYHPERGEVQPAEFIALAEENGLIVPIGEWVLRAACTDAAVWQRAGFALRVAVNLSPLQFKDPRLVQTVRDTLAQSGLAPELLELEVTESALMEDSEATLATLLALRDLGVKVALDDFGTGYSSMSCLKRMPLTNVKVDQSFVKGLPRDGENLAIVRAILSLAKSLGFTVTAEGVETIEQVQALRTLACDALQGFYFSRPVPAAEIPALLAHRWSTGAAALTRVA
jgi:predicted signal transduction protein with EAL and GGDEF domain/FixJ family two-component response regulator